MNCAYILFFVHLPIFLLAENDFKAAVFEPMITKQTAMGIQSRADSIKRMKKVLEGYADVADTARKEGVNILVFPENGLIADMNEVTRNRIVSFLDTIPEPNKEKPWIPCDEPNLYNRTELQTIISCIAKSNKIYLVVNVGDLQPCNSTEDPNCPDDNHYQYNTNVVYSSEGALVSRYHKKHLFYEPYYDSPLNTEYAVFDTPFGRFASIICFDIYFKDTLHDLIEKHNVSNILFPNLWFDTPPFFLSVLFHNSIAKAYNINLISANIRINTMKEFNLVGGSGIYTPSKNNYIYKAFNNFHSNGYLSLEVSNIGNVERNFPWPPKRLVPKSNNTMVKSGIISTYFPVSVVVLEYDSGIVSVCKFNACCSLEYEFISNRTSKFKINYILGIANKRNVNLKDKEGVEMQSCFLCPIYDDKISCIRTFPKDVPIEDVSFKKLNMTAHNFRTPYFFPHIATFNEGNFIDINTSWRHDRGQIENTKTIENLYIAMIFGRLYPQTSSAAFTVISAPLLILMFIIYLFFPTCS